MCYSYLVVFSCRNGAACPFGYGRMDQYGGMHVGPIFKSTKKYVYCDRPEGRCPTGRQTPLRRPVEARVYREEGYEAL